MRILGHILLWAGFIGGSLAATQQREFDLLTIEDRETLNRLPHGSGQKLYLNTDELESITKVPLAEMSSEDMVNVVDQILLVHNQNKAKAAAKDESAESAESIEGAEGAKAKKAKPVTFASLVKGRTASIENRWPTVPWLWYGISAAVGIGGVVLLRRTANPTEQQPEVVEEQFNTLTASLEKLQTSVGDLHQSLAAKKPSDVVRFIDDECAESLADFAATRSSLIQKFGLQPYAEIMTQFASAERFLNRSWSAAADGYMGEVAECVDRAKTHLQEAHALIAASSGE